jgi:hypothetical protein
MRPLYRRSLAPASGSHNVGARYGGCYAFTPTPSGAKSQNVQMLFSPLQAIHLLGF